MNNKYLYTALIGCAIALNAVPLEAKEKSQPDSSNNIFVCATQQNTPTMYAYIPGDVNLTPLMSWYSEYLPAGVSGKEICQATANKLQASVGQEEERYLKVYSEKNTQANLVCLVQEEDQTCDSQESEKLFSVNPNYNPSCVLENKRPIDCMAAFSVRGVYSYNEQPYQPLWWPW